ncbi:MAG TPA: deoxyribodipyrimidine photo-lyase [Candidatus Ozemobacteraceae bacterium]|nr:deoxyribodipyrimidine photo-lyase [Candidatus Ozemobacteraceae bacterium]
MKPLVNPRRVRSLADGRSGAGPVVYWMQRDQRAEDNWALLAAWQQAVERQRPLLVVFCLVSDFLEATMRQFSFLLKGLEETSATLTERGIAFTVLTGAPAKVLPAFLREHDAACLYTDFNPLRLCRTWKAEVLARISIPAFEVDAHNVVPAWVASPKLEVGARTLRPKIHRLLPEFLEEFPRRLPDVLPWKQKLSSFDWDDCRTSLKVRRDIGELTHWVPGTHAALSQLKTFASSMISSYDTGRNDPNVRAQSDLSPYLHFGQIAPQRVALVAARAAVTEESCNAFLEELIVRRELADNFCLYEPRYDSVDAFPRWARESLQDHLKDPRPHRYTLEQFERAETHDALWNAAQRQMVNHGKMHGYLRMYWGKKILEWCREPHEALAIANLLNDRYELDGRDPNGYAGTAWSIGGVHDRAWPTRPIFGKVRYMNLNGCRGKFDVDAFVNVWGT